MKERLFIRFHTGIFFIFLYLVLQIPYTNKWIYFSDPYDYMHQAKMSLSEGFLSPKPDVHFFPRAFVAPFIFKIADVNEHKIFEIQKVIHALGAGLLFLSLMPFVAKLWLRYALALVFYTFMCWWNIIGWTILPVSESLNLSFMFMWLAAFIHLLARFNYPRIALFLLASFILIFTRDTWSYILVFFSMLFVILAFLYRKQSFKPVLFIFITICIFFVMHRVTVNIGQRDKLALFNTLCTRITPNPDHFKWFTDHGLPAADSLRANFSGYTLERDHDYIQKVYAAYESPTYRPVFDWITNGSGRSAYVKFLLAHPSYFLLINEKSAKIKEIFRQQLGIYIDPPPRGFYNEIASRIPLFNNWLVLALSILCLFIFSRKKEVIYLLPFLLIVFCVVNVLLIYNADTFERERHFCFIPVTLQLTAIISIALLLNIPFAEFKQLFSRNKNLTA